MWNNQKQKKKLFSFMSTLQIYYHFKLDFQKVVNPRHQTSQGQSVAKPDVFDTYTGFLYRCSKGCFC